MGMTGKDEILANFVNMNKEHQILSNEWNKNKKMLNTQILEMKQNEMRITELMLEQMNEKYKSLTNQYAISKQEKIALIKEVKKLRKIIIEKDDKKNEILSKMSENEILHNQQIEDLNQEIC